MKTENLIDLIGEDVVRVGTMSSISKFLALGAVSSAIALFMVQQIFGYSIRADYTSAILNWNVALKQLLPLVLALILIPMVARFRFPEGKLQSRDVGLILLVVLLLVGAFAIAFVSEPMQARGMAIRGKSLAYCLPLIPAFALPVFAATIYALRNSAAFAPRLTGFSAGLLAGAIGCAVYAFTCVDDNPLFWTWAYSGGILISGVLGALIAPRFIRW